MIIGSASLFIINSIRSKERTSSCIFRNAKSFMRRLQPYLLLSANTDQDQERVLFKALEISIFIWPERNVLWNSWIDSTFTKKLQRSVFDDFISRKGCAFSVYCLFILSQSCFSSIWNIQRHLEAPYWRVSSIYLSLTVPNWEPKAKWHNIHLCMWQDKLLFCPPEQYTAQDIICGRRIFFIRHAISVFDS